MSTFFTETSYFQLELQSVGLKLDEEETLDSCKNQWPQSRTKEQRKERDSSKNGRLDMESSAPDRSRMKREINEHSKNRDGTTKDNLEPQGTRTRKKHISSKDIGFNPRHQTSESKALRHHDEGNTNPSNKEVRRRGSLNNASKERNEGHIRKTSERAHSCKTHRIMEHNSANVHGTQTIIQTKGKNIKDPSENTEHRKHKCNTINLKAYTANSKEHADANKSLKNPDWRQQEKKSNKRDSDEKHSNKERRYNKRTQKTSSLLDGAPRLRQVLSLTPDRHKGRIWTPLYLSTTESSSQGKKDMTKNVNKVNKEKEQETKKNSNSREKYKTLHKPSTSKVQREWEEARLTMLLGTQFKSSSNNNKDKQEDEVSGESYAIAEIRSNYQSTQESLNPSAQHDEADKVRKSHTPFDSPDTHEARGDIPDSKISETPQRDDHTSQRPKLSTCTRTIYKIESGLSFARERKDKTPYLDRSFGTPWLGDPLFNTSGSSFSSSRTPTDPTLEKSCEDPLGSQGTESHLNTTVHSITTTWYQEQQEEKNEVHTTIKESGINQSQKYLCNSQYSSKGACSPPSVLYGYENSKHNEGTCMVNERCTDWVTDPHQFVTHQGSTENKSMSSLCLDPNSFHWLGAHENKTLPTQHQCACQSEASPEGTSDMVNPSGIQAQVPSSNKHGFQNASYRQYDSNSNQSPVITDNGNFLGANEMLNYLDHSSGTVSLQALPHPVNMPSSHLMAKEYNINQNLLVNMSQSISRDKPLAYNHNSQFHQYSEAPECYSSSQCLTSSIQNGTKWQHGNEKSEDSFIYYKGHSGLNDMRRQAEIEAREQQHLRHGTMGNFHGGNFAYTRETNCFLPVR